MAHLPGTDGADRVFRFVSRLQRSIAVSMARPCSEALHCIASAADTLPLSLAPLETRVVRGVLLETLVRLSRLAAILPGPKYQQCLHEVACADYEDLAGAFRRACRALPMPHYRDRPELGTSELDPRVRLILDRIRADPRRRRRLNSLATDVGLSRWHMEHLIKSTTGLTYTAHVRLMRMELAAEQLRSPVRQIKQIAADLGYAQQSDFNRDFRRVHGVGPRSWRQARTGC